MNREKQLRVAALSGRLVAIATALNEEFDVDVHNAAVQLAVETLYRADLYASAAIVRQFKELERYIYGEK